MTKRDIAGFLGVNVQTLRNWKKTRPNLYESLCRVWRLMILSLKANKTTMNSAK
ncbi:hypothetical protein OFO03_00140 [Campylobacter sp. JMF_02 ED1]|uniref:hypothetical protein n=1 Tax=unclassified Campylobacter TaxID=2593542 RepID=UPI0022E99E9D|nr:MULTISPECIES: hypothetical protein [unclassified Campylobacter]MDA3048971.1 hypothetical protein [Campylobacter sp. JMF_15 NE4]MDA3050318.1 hypothetical protein [Campylobacter sp. JMF_02 ED1]